MPAMKASCTVAAPRSHVYTGMTWRALPLTSGGSCAHRPMRAQAPPHLSSSSSSTRTWQWGMKTCRALQSRETHSPGPGARPCFRAMGPGLGQPPTSVTPG
eukprot:697829-Alexandrium_andersonii.AAC.1